MDSTVKLQYEIFPYPTSSFFWRPQMTSLLHANYEAGHALIHKKLESHRGKKILLLGCGTNEPLIFALGHPHAEITAVDLSQKSLNSAKRKCLLRGTGNIQFLSEDLQNLNTTPQHHGQYDYIHCYGVLHHLPNPEQGFKNLSKLLSDNGFARVMVYSQSSRFRISLLRNLLKTLNIDFTQKDFKKKALKVINSLPLSHPLRLTFETHTEIKSTAGLVDAFLHACESPLRFQELKTILENSKLYIHQWDLSQNIKNLLSEADGKTLEDKIYFLEKTSQWPTHFTFWVSKKQPQLEPNSTAVFEYVKNPLCKSLPHKFYSPLLKKWIFKNQVEDLKESRALLPIGPSRIFYESE